MTITIRDEIERWPLTRLVPYARNSRTHSAEQVSQIAASMREWGWTNPILAREDGTLIAGHGRVLAAQQLGIPEAPVIVARGWSDAQVRAYVIADNKLAENAGWDDAMLALELGDLMQIGFDMDLTGFSAEELAGMLPDVNGGAGAGDESGGIGSLAARFLIAPFSVLNAREGWWQNRKGAWLALGIVSELGRGDCPPGGGGGIYGHAGPSDVYKAGKAAPGGSQMPGIDKKTGKVVRTDSRAKPISVPAGLAFGEIPNYGGANRSESGTSIFDPVLCELSYLWFSPHGGMVLDPFAGGSVRGIVAAKLGRQYIGHELRAEQVAANRLQADDICGDDKHPPAWIAGDSRLIDQTCADVDADLIFTCPPYADLEVYSDNPLDLSTMAYSEFRAAYFEIIAKTCARLKNNRFAVCIVGEVRDKKGNYIDFIGDTVQAFRDAGLEYYNEAILITMVGSLPIRAGKQFSASRKLGKTHQNVLVFVKGDGKKAASACGEVEVSFELHQAPDEDKYGVEL